MNPFQWLAGGDSDILNECSKSEKVKIIGFGTLVIIPAIVGIFSMTYAISTITENSLLRALAGIIWFFIVLFIDRFIVSTLYKSELKYKANFGWAVFARYAFALFVGIAVAHPMTLLWFDKGIKEGIDTELRTQLSNEDNSFLTYKKDKTAIIDSLESRKECLEVLYTKEWSGEKATTPCGSTTGELHFGPACEKIQEQIDGVVQEINEKKKEIQPDIDKYEKLINQKKSQIGSSKSYDYLSRVRMLSKLEKGEGGSDIRAVKVFIILFFIFLDILPITLKISTSYGGYEAVRDSQIQNEINKQNAIQDGSKIFYGTYYTKIYTRKLQQKEINKECVDTYQFYVKYYETYERLQSLTSQYQRKGFEEMNNTDTDDLRKIYKQYSEHIEKIGIQALKQLNDILNSYDRTAGF